MKKALKIPYYSVFIDDRGYRVEYSKFPSLEQAQKVVEHLNKENPELKASL